MILFLSDAAVADMENHFFTENFTWRQALITFSSVLILLPIFHRFFYHKTSSKPFPALKSGKFLLFYCFFRSMSRKSNHSLNYLLCLILQLCCGLCMVFEKDRIFRIYIAMKPFVFFYKPETVEVVLSSTVTIDKAKEYDFLNPWLGTGLLTSTGKKWRQRRKLLTPSFHFKILEDFIPIFDDKSNILVSILNKLQHEPWIDIVPLVTSCTLDIICETAMGVSINAQKGGCSEYVTAIHEVGNIFLFRAIRPWMHLDFVFNWSPSGKIFNKNVKIIHSFTRKVIKEKKEEMIKEGQLTVLNGVCVSGSPMNTRKHRAFLELLLKYHLKDPSFTEEDIREEVDTFMFEGHDTTGMALCWALYLIGLDKKVQQLVHEEMDDIFGDDDGREITREDLTRMKYLECVIKETLRLFPSVPFIGREVKESFKVLDYTIKPGSVCFVFPYMLHRDSESFPNPEKFDPERFFPEQAAGRHPYAYVPFSAGPRNCIGQKFALMEEKTVLANILRNFKVTSKDPMDKVKVTPNLIIRNLDPLKMNFTPRKKSDL